MVTRREANVALLSVMLVAAMPGIGVADAALLKLPAPQLTGGMPLMDALRARHSTREFADRPLPPQMLSNLLWAAWGVNRPVSGLRTAPSSHESMDVDVYLAMANGVWIYDPKANQINRVMQDDIRGETTTGQAYVKTAPLNLIFASDTARLGNLSDADRILNGTADSAVIAQNVYLFCASEGLAAVVRASVPREQLAKRLGLRPTQAIYLAQSVGFPA